MNKHNTVPGHLMQMDVTLKGMDFQQGLVSVVFMKSENHYHFQFEVRGDEATYRLIGVEIDVKRGKSVNVVLNETMTRHFHPNLEKFPYDKLKDVVRDDIYEYLYDLLNEDVLHEEPEEDNRE